MENNKKTKSQMSFEFLIILAFVTGVALFFFFAGINTTKPFVRDNIYAAGEKVTQEVDYILKLGEYNKKKINIDFPENVVKYSFANGDLIVEALFEEGKENFYFQQSKKIVGEVDGNLVIEYIRNTTSDYICMYPKGSRIDCCFDFTCTLG